MEYTEPTFEVYKFGLKAQLYRSFGDVKMIFFYEYSLNIEYRRYGIIKLSLLSQLCMVFCGSE